MISVAWDEPPEDIDKWDDVFNDSKMDGLGFNVDHLEEDEAFAPLKPVRHQQMEELLPGAKEEETHRFMILGDRVSYEEEEGTSGSVEGHFVNTDFDRYDIFTESDSLEDGNTNYDEECNSLGLECSVCLEYLSNDRALQEHMRMHTGERYICYVCDLSFISLEQLHRHRLIRHSQRRPEFECTVCHKLFNRKQYLKTHMRLHTGERPFPCDQCDKSFISMDRLRGHQKQVHLGERPRLWECPVCYKKLSCRTSLRAHVLGHEGKRPRPFTCGECGSSFTTKQSCDRHAMIHTGERPFPCDGCDSRFRTRHELADHKKRKHSGENTTSGERKAPEAVVSSPHMCYICLSIMPSYRSLVDHMRTHTAELPFCCEVCGLSFTSEDLLYNHRRKRHPAHSQPVTCTVCNKDFADPRALKLHMFTHSGERCTVCQKETTPRRMEVHMRTHNGERPFSCEECGSAFRDKRTLQNHMKRHKGKRPHVCGECGRGFVAKWVLEKHFQEVHRNSIYVERGTDDGVVREVSEKSTEDGTSGETTQDALFESDVRLDSKLHPDMANDCTTERDNIPPHLADVEKRRDSESTLRVPDMNVLEAPLPEVQQQETNRLVMFGEDMDYGEVAWSSEVVETSTSVSSNAIVEKVVQTGGIVELSASGNITASNRTRELSFDFAKNEESGLNPGVQESGEVTEMEQMLPGVKDEKTDRLVLFKDTSTHDDDAMDTSGVVESSPSGSITLNHGEAPIPFVHLKNARLQELKALVMEEPLFDTKKEETNQFVIMGGRVVSEEKVTSSEIEENFLSSTESKASHLLIEEYVSNSALTLFTNAPETPGPSSTAITVNAGISDLQCSVCYTHFDSRVALYKHLCTPSGELQFPCNICDAIYPLIDDLRSHLLTHGVDNAHICDECGRIFKGNKSLKSHKMTHTGMRPFVCKLCGNDFPNKTSLTRHMNTHPEKKERKSGQYACDYCKYKTRVLRCIRNHLQQKHGDIMYAPESSTVCSLRSRRSKDAPAERGFKCV